MSTVKTEGAETPGKQRERRQEETRRLAKAGTPIPVITIMSPGGIELRVYALRKGDWMKCPGRKTATFEGPSLVYQEQSNTGIRTTEVDVDDLATWDWIEELMKDGVKYRTLRPGHGV